MEQIEILKQWLLSENIPFEYNYEKMPPDFLETMGEFILSEEEKLSRNQIFLRNQHENGYDISIICQFGSWGVKQGLLEYWRMGKDEEPVGYCTAEEVIEVIKEWVKDKEIVLKFDSLEITGDISVGDIVAMFAAGLQQVCDMLEKDLGNNNEDFNFALGMLIHSIIAGKTDKEIGAILIQTELIRQDYKKFMENNKED